MIACLKAEYLLLIQRSNEAESTEKDLPKEQTFYLSII